MIGKNLIFLVMMVLLTSCSFGGNAEQNQSEDDEVDSVTQIRRKQEIMEAKSQAFPYVADLSFVESQDQGDFQVQAYRNDYSLDNETLIEVEGILPDTPLHFYEAWLTDDSEAYVSLGALEYTAPNLYFVQFKQDENIGSLSAVLLSSETVADDMPDEIIARGVFE